mgnify:CR=1 FL=1|tara:strand:- start:4816 stop:5004 length:189 start_codon:yes stop_codon:yes gene_type:complete
MGELRNEFEKETSGLTDYFQENGASWEYVEWLEKNILSKDLEIQNMRKINHELLQRTSKFDN